MTFKDRKKEREYQKQYQKQYQIKNKDKRREYKKKYIKLNKKRISKYSKQWRQINIDKVKANAKAYSLNNRERIHKYGKIWRLNNKDKTKASKLRWVLRGKRKEYDNKRRYTDMNFRIKCILYRRIHHALKDNYKSKRTMELVGCSIKSLLNHLESQFDDMMSWNNYGLWHVDHIQPCASFDLTKEEEQLKCFHYSNLQPLWRDINFSKGSKV
jgi:hypothetical protein